MPIENSTEFMQYCPSSPRHRTLPNGQIEVEGEGIIFATNNYWGDEPAIRAVHEKFGGLLAESAERHGIPYAAALAIAVVEGGWKRPDFVNSANAGGVMALTPGAFKGMRGYTPSREEMLDYATNIDVGVQYLASNWKQFREFPAAAAAYNAGSPKCSPTTRCKSTINGKWDFDGTTAQNSWGMVEDCTQGKNTAYARRAVAVMNSAIEMGLGGGSAVSMDGDGLWYVVAGIAVGVLTFFIANEVMS
jgi:hypothetical protein